MAMGRALKIIFFLTFVLWLWLWIMLPTKLYKNYWTPKLNMNLNSTFFREQGMIILLLLYFNFLFFFFILVCDLFFLFFVGTNLLLFSFPIMLMAVLGCFYLHFQKKSSELDPKPFSTQRFLTI